MVINMLQLLFLISVKLLFVSCARNSSLTFVIDDTGSMYDDIDQVRKFSGAIMDIIKREKTSEIEDVVLVTFNDPDVVFREKTSNRDTLLMALRNVKPHGGDDCPEYAMTGIETALQRSNPNSYLFVFTDAPAKDYRKVDEVISLCQKKQSQVVFIVTDPCQVTEKLMYFVYHKIAMACSGQVFKINKIDVHDLFKPIKETVRGHKTILTSQVLVASLNWQSVPFTVDDQSEYVIASASGDNVYLRIKDSPYNMGKEFTAEKLMWTSSAKVLKLNAPSPGTYYAWVKAGTDVSVVVYARTDFSFDHGFSSFEPKSLEDTSKQPIKDKESFLSLTIEDPNFTVDIESVEILDMQERHIKRLELFKKRGNFYITDKFVSPTSTFKIQVIGINKNTGNVIKRLGRTNINPQDPPKPDSKAPEVVIKEGTTVEVEYDAAITLTCKVSAYPEPKIVWKTDNGADLDSKSALVEKPYEHISYLQVSHVKVSDTYHCTANNAKGSKVAKILVNIRHPLKAVSVLAETTTAKFGKQKKLKCYNYSRFPVDIKWKVPLKLSNYRFKDNNNVLMIEAVNMDAQGDYSCTISLKSDPRYEYTDNTTLTIEDLAPPSVSSPEKNVTGKFGNQMKMACKITGGIPTPKVNWQVMKKGDKTYKAIDASGEELTIKTLALEDSGTYLCIADNLLGHTEKTIELLVTMEPTAIIKEGSSRYFPYGTTLDLTCKIVGSPLPSVAWKDSKGNILLSRHIVINNEITNLVRIENIKNPDTYYCYAENVVGYTTEKIQINVTSPFDVASKTPAQINSKYGATTDIICNIKSKFPMKIKWFFEKATTKTAKIEIHSSDIYTISINEDTLRIKSTGLNEIGKYTCEASLISDHNQTVAMSTEVRINDLSPPVLEGTADAVVVNNTDRATIHCKVVGGTPPPTISWQVKHKADSVYRHLPSSGQELTIASATLANAGQYRCKATNHVGVDMIKDTELVVQKVPDASIAEGSSLTVSYASTFKLNCSVVAYPQPIIVWKNSKGQTLKARVIIINDRKTVSILQLLNVKSSESYSCSANNRMGEDVRSINVTVEPAIVFPNQEADTSVNYGAPANITCDAKSSFPMQIKWFYKKDNPPQMLEIQTKGKYKISKDGRRLLITSTDLNVVGKYICEASIETDKNETKTHTFNVEINDWKSPEIVVNAKSIIVMKGQRAITSCQATGVPKPTLTWQFKAKKSDNFVPLSDQELASQTTNTAYSSSGAYKCIATNAVGTKSTIIDVSVHGKPEITNVDSVYLGITGDMVLRVPCNVTGVPEPTIVWKHDGKVITSDSKVTVDRNSLFIKDPNTQDSVNYTCEATNKYGTAAKNLETYVSDDIEIDLEKSRYIYLKLGESTDEIKCDLPNSGPASVRWYMRYELTKVRDVTYHLRNARYSDDGNYTCRANTAQGTESLNYVVDVGYMPRFPYDSEFTIDWIGNTEDTLDCKVDAKPVGNITWYFNGNEVSHNDLDLPITGWGRYGCRVSNVHGSLQRDFEVTSSSCVLNITVGDTSKNMPLLLSEKRPQLLTNNILNDAQNIILRCATKTQNSNTFKTHPSAKTINAQCYKENQLIVDGNKYKFEDLQCSEKVMHSSSNTKKPCMKKGELMSIGFDLNDGFLGVYEVCYEQTDHKILYTKVSMSDANLGNFIAKVGNGAVIVKCQYNNRRLVNSEDVAFGPAQGSILSDKYNTVPIFEPCDGSSRTSWRDIEDSVQTALETVSSLSVWTGASVYDAAGTPRYLWKLVKFEDHVETVVFVNALDANNRDILCPPNDSNSLSLNIDTNDKYTYMCDLNDFLKAFKLSTDDLYLTA